MAGDVLACARDMSRNEVGQAKWPLLAMIGGGILLLMAVAYVATGGLDSDDGDDERALAARCAFPACRAAEDPGLARGYEGPSVAVNPEDEDHMVVVDAKMTAGHCTWHVTFDRGKEWLDGTFQGPDGYNGCKINGGAGGHVPIGPASVAFGPSGRVYAAYGSAHRPDQGSRESVILATSTDGGKEFSTAVAARPPGDEFSYARPQMSVVAGPNGADRILLAFWLCRENGRFCESAMFARSDDGGATFTSPVTLNDPPAGQTPSEPLQTADGTIYVTFARRYSDGPTDLILARSSDGGATFTYSTIDNQLAIGDRYDTAKLGYDERLNNLYIVYSDARTGGQQIFFRKSADRGVTWGEPVGIAPGQDAQTTGTSRTPSISVAPNGRIDLVYYRRPQANTDNVFWAYSIDGGTRFVSRQVNERPIRRFPFAAAIGDWYPPDITSTDTAAVIVWSDTTNAADQDQNVQDVFLRRMSLSGDELPP